MTEKDLDVAIEMCERIMEFDTRTMQNPVSENGWIFEKVYELLQYLRQLQFATDKNVGGDLIDRQAALDIYDDYNVAVENGELEAYKKHRERLLELPSTQPGWIPWDSGGFPEESGTYTVTAYDGATKRVTYAKYQKRLKRWELTGARAYWKVLAWQPLPTPYREGGQE